MTSWYQKASKGSKLIPLMEQFRKLKSQNVRSDMIYSGSEDFVLKEGTMFQSQPLTSDEVEEVQRMIDRGRDTESGACFFNAQDIACISSQLSYCEGFAMTDDLPMHVAHAWNTINGKVIDFTWKMLNSGQPVLGVIPAGWEYMGVEMPRQMVYSMWRDVGEASSLIDNYHQRWPLLMQPWEKVKEEATQSRKDIVTEEDEV